MLQMLTNYKSPFKKKEGQQVPPQIQGNGGVANQVKQQQQQQQQFPSLMDIKLKEVPIRNKQIQDEKMYKVLPQLLKQQPLAPKQTMNNKVLQTSTPFKQIRQPPQKVQQQKVDYVQDQATDNDDDDDDSDKSQQYQQDDTMEEEMTEIKSKPQTKKKQYQKQQVKKEVQHKQFTNQMEEEEPSTTDDQQKEINTITPKYLWHRERDNGKFVSLKPQEQRVFKKKTEDKVWKSSYIITQIGKPKLIDQQNQKTKRKWCLDFQYVDQEGNKKHQKKIRFGKTGFDDYIDHHDLAKREKLLNNLRNPTNPLKPNFWTLAILNQTDDLLENLKLLQAQI